MGILSIVTDQAGQIGFNPRIVKIITTDNLSAVTTAGYLNPSSLQGFTILPTDEIHMWYGYVSAISPGAFDVFLATISNGVITLSPDVSGGNVLLPVLNAHFATFNGTSGQIKSDAATAINLGNIQAGLSGTAGYVSSFPATAARGSLRLTAVANTGDTLTTLSNVAMGQASVVSIPDPVNALGRLLIGATATPFVSGNFPVASGTGGLMVDSGVAAADIQVSTNIIAATSADIGGGGAGPITVPVAGLTAASVVVATVESSSNPVSVVAATAGVAGFDITFSADPGAACLVNYVAFIAAQ